MISALIELMNTYYLSGDFTDCGTVAWTLFKSVPDDIVSAHFLALAYIKTGRHGDARTLFEQLRTRLPKRARPARTSIAAEQRAEAVCLSEAIVRNPGYAATWHALALDLEQSGQGTASVALLRLAIAARPATWRRRCATWRAWAMMPWASSTPRTTPVPPCWLQRPATKRPCTACSRCWPCACSTGQQHLWSVPAYHPWQSNAVETGHGITL